MKSNKRVIYTAIALAAAIIMAAANLAGLYYLDNSIGSGNVQVIQTTLDINADYFTQWSYGIIPHLKIVPAEVAEQEDLRIWAKPGDYAGAKVMGITFALSAIMWFTWIGSYLGFPGNIVLLRQRMLGLLAALILTVITNLIFARMTTEFSDANTVLGSAFGHISIGLSAGGIWFITLLSRLGVGQHDSRPTIPASQMKDEKLSALLMGLVTAFIIESVLIRSNLALPNLSLDFVIWAITIIAFFNYYGYMPSKWLKGERPTGIAMTVVGTIITLALWIVVQQITGGAIGAELLTANGSRGLSLMLGLWLLFWLSVSSQSGKSSPIRTAR